MSFGQGGYGGPGGQGPGGPGGVPDWGALAEAAEAERRRRRRWLVIGGGAVATVAIAGIVAAAVVTTSDGGGSPSASDDKVSGASSPGSDEPEPSFSKVAPPPDPEEYIATEDKDTAPMPVSVFFPSKKITVSGHAYARTATHSTRDCASGASTKLGGVLSDNGCQRLFRATYTRGGVAVTVGVAVFADDTRAARAQERAAGNLESLPGGGVPAFCRATACRLTSNALGRYGYFTVAGYTSGKAVSANDAKTRAAVRDTGGYVFRRIMDRGRTQALADAKSQTASP